MKSRYIYAKVSGIVAAFLIFLLTHFIFGIEDDGNLVVFGVPAIIGGFIVFYTLRFINRFALKLKKK